MKELNHHSEIKWIKKFVKNSVEIENLKYLMQLTPNLLPSIKIITDNYYIMEKCNVIEPKDFAPANFYRLYSELLMPLHKFKKNNYTPGIYKYFAPYTLNSEIKEQYYIPYIMNELKKLICNISIDFTELLEDTYFLNLVRSLNSISIYFKDWKPYNGYNLLHGDLHIGNIVKKNNSYLLIDFEYLHYGSKELEIANFIISSLIWHYKKNHNYTELKKLIIDYFQTCNEFSFFDYSLLKFFFVYSLTLFYLSAYLKKDKIGLETIHKITELYRIIGDDKDE
ncbi:MAG TPA: hypothetical protein PLW61_01275 [Caldisericia bacterium]|nr:hypothetical protein [Caldisericia bacterium]HPB33387.1 hypothetical protein [Caldisericia bacterium]HQL66827.1 hypothetical protein [Caldisericia bacterium]HQN48032.1 hypothetical protein [Caldisericia bacterium]HQO99136.1 hypothetical protein [Caldisericia bacterium]